MYSSGLGKAALVFRKERGGKCLLTINIGHNNPKCSVQIHLTTPGEKEGFRGRVKRDSSTEERWSGPSNQAKGSSALSLYENHSPERHLAVRGGGISSIPSRKPHQLDQLPAEGGHLCAGT